MSPVLTPSELPEATGTGSSLAQKIGLPLGALLFILILMLPAPEGLTPAAKQVGAVSILMAIWWITEAIPLYATALLPLALFPLLGIAGIKETAAPYAEPTIFLFMGGFFLAMAMQRWGLHKRIALLIVRVLGTQPRRLLLGFMIATAVMSMWVSNTATTMMVFPIGLAMIAQFSFKGSNKDEESQRRFGVALMLGIAYAASIGGVGTLIGTPPNAIFAGQSRLLFPELAEVTFFKWMLIGLPYVALFLPLAWFYLAFFKLRNLHIESSSVKLREEIKSLGPVSRGELGTFLVFCFAVLGWLTRKNIDFGGFAIPGWSNLLGVEAWTGDATVAIVAGLLLFIIPVDRKEGTHLLNWEWAIKIPWGILILFGGGFALAFSFQETGLAAWLGNGLAVFSSIPLPLYILILCLLITLIGELASNTALAAMLLPILGATAAAMGVHPYLLIIPATIAASSGFMLPVATPPNAIVFGSGVLTIREMVKAGAVMDVVGAILITLITFVIVIPLFGL